MTDIPKDVMEAAMEAMGKVPGMPEFIIYERCARAILAERERCAKIAEDQRARVPNHDPDLRFYHDFFAQGYGNASLNIVRRIRDLSYR